MHGSFRLSFTQKKGPGNFGIMHVVGCFFIHSMISTLAKWICRFVVSGAHPPLRINNPKCIDFGLELEKSTLYPTQKNCTKNKTGNFSIPYHKSSFRQHQ